MSKAPEDRDRLRVLARLAASAPPRARALLPGGVGALAEKALARWSPSAAPPPASLVVAVRVRDVAGGPRRGAAVRQVGAARRAARTGASGVALVELDRALAAKLSVECDGQELSGALDVGSSAAQRIGAAQGVVADARVARLGEAAFPGERPPARGRPLRVALCGAAERLADAAPLLERHACFELRAVFATDAAGAAGWAQGRDVRPLDELSHAALEQVDLLLDLSGDERVRALRRARAGKGKAKGPALVLSLPHHRASVLEPLLRRIEGACDAREVEMPWDEAIEAEYDALIDGVVGQATDLPAWWLGSAVKDYVIELERGGAANLSITPASSSHLTAIERLLLHSMRIACALYVERNGFFPWRLVDHTVAELRPLVGYHHQGLRESEPGRHVFHHVWDVEPGLRMAEAVLAYFIAELFGLDMPRTEGEMVVHFVQWMRDVGWIHMSGDYDDFADQPDHGGHVYDFDVFTEVKRSGCHATADYVVAGLRHFNVPAHYGRGWSGAPPTGSAYWDAVHQHGHCFIHFATEGWWLSHADDVYNGLWKTVPPECAMMSDVWMEEHHFDQSEYTWSRGRAAECYLWWCFLIGRSPDPNYDVPTLYANGALRERLEDIHVASALAERDGAPAEVPPVFDEATVDTLMGWVALVLAEH